MVTQQQRKATEQVGRSMDDMAATVSEAMACTRQTAATASDLVKVALRLNRMVGSGRIRVDGQSTTLTSALRAFVSASEKPKE